ncbi:MAG TPA: DMT family transporter [Hyphomicrobiaceae bacterium]|nr:DMT family transporter [Hyphomicrobiaceae bacterium]
MRRQDWIELVTLSLLWGATFLAIAVAIRDVPTATLVFFRVFLAAVVLLPVVYALGYRLPSTISRWRDFAAMAVLNNVLPFSLFVFAQHHITASLTSVLNATTPLMTLLVARALAGETLQTNKLIGVVLGLAGVAILIGPDLVRFDGATALGMLAALGGTLCYGFSGLWGRRFKEIPPLVSATSQLVMSSLILLPIAAVTDRFWTLPMPPTQGILAILSLAVLSTALAYILFYRIMGRAGSNNVMLVTLLIPVSAIALGILVLGESLTLRQIAGAAVIAASLLIIDGRLFRRGAPSAGPSPGKG